MHTPTHACRNGRGSLTYFGPGPTSRLIRPWTSYDCFVNSTKLSRILLQEVFSVRPIKLFVINEGLEYNETNILLYINFNCILTPRIWYTVLQILSFSRANATWHWRRLVKNIGWENQNIGGETW